MKVNITFAPPMAGEPDISTELRNAAQTAAASVASLMRLHGIRDLIIHSEWYGATSHVMSDYATMPRLVPEPLVKVRGIVADKLGRYLAIFGIRSIVLELTDAEYKFTETEWQRLSGPAPAIPKSGTDMDPGPVEVSDGTSAGNMDCDAAPTGACDLRDPGQAPAP